MLFSKVISFRRHHHQQSTTSSENLSYWTTKHRTQNSILSASGREREASCYQTNVKLNQKVHKIQLTAIYWRDKNWNVCRWYVKKSLSLLSVKLSAMFIFSSLWLVPLSSKPSNTTQIACGGFTFIIEVVRAFGSVRNSPITAFFCL